MCAGRGGAGVGGHGSVSPSSLKWVTVPWMRWGALSSWFKMDMGQCHLLVSRGSVSPLGLRWISVISWFEVGECPLDKVGQMGVSVTSMG